MLLFPQSNQPYQEAYRLELGDKPLMYGQMLQLMDAAGWLDLAAIERDLVAAQAEAAASPQAKTKVAEAVISALQVALDASEREPDTRPKPHRTSEKPQ